MKPRLLFLLLFICSCAFARGDDWPQWRGLDRTAVSKEKELLQSWPKDGPKLLWTCKNAGLGFGSPSIVGNRLYILGARDEQTYLLCLDVEKGAEVWQHKIGKIFTFEGNTWGDGPRSTPTVDGELVFALDGTGELVCVKTDGKEVWRKNLIKDFGGKMMTVWGYSESPLIDGDLLLVSPGGPQGTLAALDKKTGAVKWRSKELTDNATYSSIMVAEIGGVRQYVQQTYRAEPEGGNIVGVRASDGKLLWKQDLFEGDSYAVAPTPIIIGNLVYVTNGYGKGCHLLEIGKKGDEFSVKDHYKGRTQKNVKNQHGGVVLVDGHIYGHSESKSWICQELKSGELKWVDRRKLNCTSGAIACAGDRLYLYSDQGEAVLLKPSPGEWDEVGRFTIPQKSMTPNIRPTSQASALWTHPVIANGRLYLRDQELLFCYDVRKSH